MLVIYSPATRESQNLIVVAEMDGIPPAVIRNTLGNCYASPVSSRSNLQIMVGTLCIHSFLKSRRVFYYTSFCLSPNISLKMYTENVVHVFNGLRSVLFENATHKCFKFLTIKYNMVKPSQ